MGNEKTEKGNCALSKYDDKSVDDDGPHPPNHFTPAVIEVAVDVTTRAKQKRCDKKPREQRVITN